MVQLTSALNLGPIERLTANLREKISQAVRRTAFLIEGDAKINCPVDTGALRASIYTVTFRGSGRDSALAEAETAYRSDQGNTEELPIAPDVPEITDELTAIVAVGMAYGIYVETGTSRMAARPFLIPAANQHRPEFEAQIKQALAEAAKEGGWS